MVTATAFACIRSHRMSVRRIQLTRELKALLIFLRFAGLANEPLDVEPVEGEKYFDGLEQRLQLVHASSAKLALPSLAALQKASKGRVDVTLPLRALGISIHEGVGPLKSGAARDYWNDPDASIQVLDQLAHAADRLLQFRENVTNPELLQNERDNAPFLFLDDIDDVFGSKERNVLRISSANEIRALLLVEPQAAGNQCRVRLYGLDGQA
jgi:hypothetical protein